MPRIFREDAMQDALTKNPAKILWHAPTVFYSMRNNGTRTLPAIIFTLPLFYNHYLGVLCSTDTEEARVTKVTHACIVKLLIKQPT